MANDLQKRTAISYEPEIKAQAAVPYRPARPAWTEVRSTRVCEIVTKQTGGDPGGLVKVITYKDGKIVVTWEYAKAVPPTLVKVRECRDVTTMVEHAAEPEQKAKPAQSYRPAGVVENFRLGWNAGARSMEYLPGGGFAEFRLQGVGVVAGFSADPQGVLWTDIEHAFYATRRSLKIVELGVEKHAAGNFEAEDLLRIERVGSRVEYRKNGELLYTSKQPSTAPVYLDASLYSGGDRVLDPKLKATGSTSARIQATMRPPQVVLADGPYAFLRAEAHPPVVSLSALRTRLRPTMRPAEVLLTDRPYASLRATMRPPEVRLATGLPAPDYALFTLVAYPPMVTLHGITGSVGRIRATMAPAEVVFADRPYAAIRAEMCPALVQFADSGYTQRPAVALPRPRVEMQTGAVMQVQCPMPQARIEGSETSNRMELVMPAAKAHIEAGAQMVLVAPAARALIEATVHEFARIEVVCPMPRVVMEATVEGLAEFRLVAPAARAEIFGGAEIQLACPMPQVRMEATAQEWARIEVVCPMPQARIEAGESQATAQFELTCPAIVAAGWGEMALHCPMPRARIEATELIPVVHESYAVNLRTTFEGGSNEMTRYTSFPFERVVRWRGRYVALAADGLYFLEGDTDAGQPIAWRVQTAISDFKSSQRKVALSGSVGGRMAAKSTFRVYTGEEMDGHYDYETPRGTSAQNYRQKFGRGLDSRYYALELFGQGELTIDDLSVEVVNKKRSV